MIVNYGCYSCQTFVRVDGDPLEIARLLNDHVKWEHGRPCFRCNGEMLATGLALIPSPADVLSMSPQELFLAWCGGGTPAEIKCARDVRACLLGAKIIRADIVDTSEISGDVRPVIQRLYLEGGTVVHLAGTSLGAMVYKVTRNGKDTHDPMGVQQKTEDGIVRREDSDLPAVRGETGPGSGEG